MKNKLINFIIVATASFSLVACSPVEKPNPDPTPVDNTFEGYEIANDKAERQKEGISEFTICAINDFHGAIKEDGYQMGLGYFGSFIKEKTSEENTLFIDSGDTWQGSLESNFNHGKLINEVYENAKISARTVGNHDFDWGLDVLKDNVKNSNFPNLAANVYDYDWDNKKTGTTQQKELGKSYATYVLDNGLKVGIIGMIGEDQITSISTQLVQNITFTNQLEKTKQISDFLRINKKCDVVILSTHASFEQTESAALTRVSSVSKQRYVDLVLNAHTHQEEIRKVNDVYFVQFGGYGQVIGEVNLYYNFETNKLVDSSTYCDSYSSYQVKSELNYKIDPEIQSIIDKYDEDTKDLGSQVLSRNFQGAFYSSEQLPNLMAEAIYEESKIEGFTVDFAYTNAGRASHYNPTMTYSDLCNIFPFDNAVSIIEVTGKEAANMLRFRNNLYRANPELQIRYEGAYKVACLDYLAFHCNNDRDYDFFPNIKILGYLTKNDKDYTYREILKDYLLANPEKVFESSYYSKTNPVFAREN